MFKLTGYNMRANKWFITITLFLLVVTSCVNKPQLAESGSLLGKLQEIQQHGIMFGHQDDPVYGIGWDGDLNRSDVKSLCGDYPAVMGFDLGHLELGLNKNLDKVPFERMRKEIIEQHKRGGIVSLSWHVSNPVTGKNSWDVSDSTVVKSVLPGGNNYDVFMSWLDRIADFMNSLQTSDGKKIPVLFRPWHEHTGSWFWWGQKLCSTEEYKMLWEITYNHMINKGASHLLYAYSPGSEPNDTTQYLERYPGDDIIDLIGVDTYQFDRAAYIKTLDKSLKIMEDVAKAHKKIMAITETGFEAIPDSVWWTRTLLPVIGKYPVSYVLVWRNAHERENHYYAPYPGQVSANDFVEFYNNPKTIFAADIEKITLR